MKGLARSLNRGSVQTQPIRKQMVPVNNVPIVSSGLTGIGFGTAVIGDLPEGNILLLGGIAYLQFTTASAAVIAAYTGSYSVGSAPTADNALAGAEIDLIPATVLAAATAKVSPLTRGAQATQAMLDNTDGTLEINLNLLLDDTSVSADANAFTVSGYVELAYVVLGDD